jgi:hypothetical protein
MINLWKLITSEPQIRVEKICDECNELIESFTGTHPLTQHLIFDLRLNDKSDLSVLEMGLAPYHWHPISKKYPNCLIPKITTQREELKQENDELKQKLLLMPSIQQQQQPPPAKFTPYKKPPGEILTWESRGRPSKIAIQQRKDKEEKKNNKKKQHHDSENNI